jgi:hypothetical protein
MSMGLGMVFVGAWTDAPLATISDVESVMPAPILGPLPANGSSDDFSGGHERQRLGGRAILACGVVLIIACLAVVVHALAMKS